jgi:hypothetical protein
MKRYLQFNTNGQKTKGTIKTKIKVRNDQLIQPVQSSNKSGTIS